MMRAALVLTSVSHGAQAEREPPLISVGDNTPCSIVRLLGSADSAHERLNVAIDDGDARPLGLL